MKLLNSISVTFMVMLSLVAYSTQAFAHGGLDHDHGSAEQTTQEDKVLAVLNGEDILQSQIDAVIFERMPQMASMPAEQRDMYLKNIRKQALESYIVEKLLDEKVKEAGIEITDEMVMAKVNEIIELRGMSMDDLQGQLMQAGKTLDDLKDDIRKGMKYEKAFESFAGDSVNVSEEEVKAYFDENANNFNVPDQVKASHILVKIEQSASEDEKVEAKTKIEEILAKVKAGEDFAELAKENSDCPSGNEGGDLGFFDRGRMVKPFSDAAFAMEVGQVSDVVETRFGYHIIKVTDKKAGGAQTFDEVKDQITQMLTNQKRSEFSGKFIEEIKSKATIVYPEEPKDVTPAELSEVKPEAEK